jgi:hypothetical protein
MITTLNYLKLIFRQPKKPVEKIYEGRTKSKLSLPSQCREMVAAPMPKHDADKVRQALYPKRAA